MNQCNFAGNLTRDPEMRYTKNNTPVVNFGMAINSGKDVAPLFIDLVAWNKQAELINEHFKKGNGIIVEASARLENWEAADGQKRSKTVFHVNRLHFPPAKGQRAGTEETVVEAPETSDVPF
jgi:single-strand DNA-binding protein